MYGDDYQLSGLFGRPLEARVVLDQPTQPRVVECPCIAFGCGWSRVRICKMWSLAEWAVDRQALIALKGASNIGLVAKGRIEIRRFGVPDDVSHG